MADAPKILGTDTLRQAYPKINQGITNANIALQGLTVSSEHANLALETATSVQAQFNKVTIEGDSSVEAAQARVDGENNEFSTLKERLDAKDAQAQTSIDDIIVKLNNRTVGKVSVTELGATGNGVDDDTAAIQSALDLALEKDFITVDIPQGVFKTTKELILRGNTHLRLTPDTIIDRRHQGNIIQNGATGDQYYGYNGNGNIIIEGGIFENNGHLVQQGTCMAIAHAENVIIKDVVIKNVSLGHGIEVNSSKNVLIKDSRFSGYDPGTTRKYSEAIQLDIAKSLDALPWFGAYDHTACKNVFIINNVIETSDELGGWGRGIGSHNATINRWFENIIVQGNIITDCLEWGIRGYHWKYASIQDNQIYKCGGGISVNPPLTSNVEDTKNEQGIQTNASQNITDIQINNNIINQGGGYGSAISVSGEATGIVENVILSGNSIRDYSGIGIYSTYCKFINIANNNIFKTSGTGISMSQGNHFNACGNHITEAGGNGITSTTINTSSIIGNDISRVGSHGIIVSTDSDTVNVNDNIIVGVGSGYQHIRVLTNVARIIVNGNNCRNITGSPAQYAIYFSSTVTNGIVIGNMCAGMPIQIDSMSSITLGTNVSS
ncbi:right-handed parallel beta-helix repeat-containing protein [Cytobacillus purgationiresistens]|uniref:Uncharacterized protein n=1 Tax=Cytobacillus purgationiresistens TaxID=863449 RepID=A0ABU0AHI3_9BACI|nr:right-handed parallel beta-helix repeat-containing protein [Cytobacillus purgationiresistens]MDQ0270717.1 hypothetical protein [Cytobacillus purgationiresistens]